MAQSSIITGHYVEVTQTPASVADRLIAAVIDYFLIINYFSAAIVVVMSLINSYSYDETPGVLAICGYVAMFFPVIFYYPAFEIFANGRSVGKMVMKMRVVTIDGNAPSVGSCLLRWILYPIDTFMTGFLGVVFILFSRHRQRLGDLAAGTIVIKTTADRYNFNFLYDYSYVHPGYQPSFPEAANLSSRQVDVISRTLYNSDPNRHDELTFKLAVKVQQYLEVHLTRSLPADVFLRTVLNDYYHYSSTIEV